MKRAVKRRVTLTLALLGIASAAVTVSAQPPGSMGYPMGPPGGGMGMGRGIMMMDQDGDGKVSMEEFMTGHEARFKQLDVNGDGYIEVQEFSGFMQRGMMPSPMPPQAVPAVPAAPATPGQP